MVADDILWFDEIGEIFSKMVENIVGKGEIARNEQFLLFPQRFLKPHTADTWKKGLAYVNYYPSFWAFLEISSF